MFKNKKKKCLFTTAITLCMVFSAMTAHAADREELQLTYDGETHPYNAEKIFIEVNGKEVNNLVMPPVSLNNRTLVPAREVFEHLGATVSWNNTTREVTVKRGTDRVILTINKTEGTKNASAFSMDTAPKIINSKTMIPVRYAAEALDCTVDWDETARIVKINDKAQAGFQNFSYDSQSHLLTLDKAQALDAASLIHTDNYLNGQYSLTLPGDYSALYGSGIFSVNDDYLSGINIHTNGSGQTVFTLQENKILACTVTETDSKLFVQLQLPKQKYNKIVVLDAGHGGKDPGAAGNGLIEKNVNLQIITKLRELLDADGNIKVYLTRTGDTYPSLLDRANMANQIGDLFVSVHQNSSTSTAPSGTEVLYTPHSNETSDKLTSLQAANIMQQTLISAMGSVDRGIQNRPKLAVLNKTKVPAILIEVGFLSNAAEASKLAAEDYQNTVAGAIYSGINELFSEHQIR